MTSTQDALEEKWKAVSKLLLKEEAGPLSDCADWLSSLNPILVRKRSTLSGKEVTYSLGDYAENSKWASLDEIDYSKQHPAINLEKITSLHPLVSAVQGRIFYAGNIILGNSKNVEKSTNVTDCFFVSDSAGHITDSKHLAYCYLGRFGERDFGIYGIGETSDSVKCCETYRLKRCFEAWMCSNSSDCYYSYGLSNCSDCMFSFHLKNRRFCIGNVQLSQEKYNKLKSALLTEMASKLKADKKLPSLMEIVSKSQLDTSKLQLLSKPEYKLKGDISIIDREFSSTASLLFSAKLNLKISDFAPWLEMHTARVVQKPSAASGKMVSWGDYCNYFKIPENRLITMQEGIELGQKLSIGEDALDGFTFANAHEKICSIAFFSPEYFEGMNSNVFETPNTQDCSNCYRCTAAVYAKNCAYSYWPRSSENVFGCAKCLESKFCINCYQSIKLTRCFEVDASENCADCYFSHNVENCQDCILCFNVKGKRYAIGNVEYPKNEYLRIKQMVLAEIAGKLEKNKSLDYDIFSIGCKK